MSVIAISMCKDERDIVVHSVQRMRRQVDMVIVADNGSTDGTREALDRLADEPGGCPLLVLEDTDPAYYQSRKMTALAAEAADLGASWVVPFDQDEVWYSPFGRIADILSDQPASVSVASAAVYDHVVTSQDVEPYPDPVVRIGWRRREANKLPKVAARAAAPVTIHQGNHGATFPTDQVDGLLVVRHFPYRSVEQFVRKVRNGVAAYAATDLPEHEGQHWRDYGRLLDQGGEQAIDEVFHAWFHAANPSEDQTLIYDPCPA